MLQVPEGYFDSLSARIQERIRLEEQTKVIPLYRRPIFRYAAAAAFIILSFSLYLSNFATQESPEQTLSLGEYYMPELDEATLIEMALESDLQTDFFSEDPISSAVIIQLIDEETLFEQL